MPVMAEAVVTNGTDGTHTPPGQITKLPHSNLALTEYSANPSPPCSTPREKIEHAGVPAHFLLPTGYPDVGQHLDTDRQFSTYSS